MEQINMFYDTNIATFIWELSNRNDTSPTTVA